MTPLDMRLLNWHYANLEYANAANVGQLSLGGWDQDGGNEFDGRHSQIIGGYGQLPRALFDHPTSLDVQLGKPVTRITNGRDTQGYSSQTSIIEAEDGECFKADLVVVTVPLGVLKHQSMKFEPPLPDWKTGAIQRLGFGLLNKVSPFQDIFSSATLTHFLGDSRIRARLLGATSGYVWPVE